MDKSKEEFVVFIHQVIPKRFTMANLDQIFPPFPSGARTKITGIADQDGHQNTKQAPWLDIFKSLGKTVPVQ